MLVAIILYDLPNIRDLTQQSLFLVHIKVYCGSAWEGRLYSTKSFRDLGMFHLPLKITRHHLAGIWGEPEWRRHTFS